MSSLPRTHPAKPSTRHSPFHILIADDEPNICKGLCSALSSSSSGADYAFFTAEDGDKAWQFMTTEDIDLAIIDLRMPKLSGEELLERIKRDYLTVPVIILTGHGSIENAVNAMRAGAYDFLTKPVDLDRLELLTERALSSREINRKNRALTQEVERLRAKEQKNVKFTSKNRTMQRVHQIVGQVADTRASVLITGESGVGKELIAESLHRLSERKDKELVKVHCAALSEALLESELFGHEKGAFTGANNMRRGRFELADGGTIFLDEIGEIDSTTQIKLLRVLQEKCFERVGGEQTLEVNVRVIAATNRNLQEEVAQGRFREDLFYRLNVVNIHIPALRERKEDLPFLIPYFLEQSVKENRRTHIEGINSKALTLLYNYYWPGNIRELQNTVESAVVLSTHNIIQPEDLPPNIRQQKDMNHISIRLGSSMMQVEESAIRATVAYAGGNKTQAAKILQIGRKTLHRKIHDYQMFDLLNDKTADE
ncbi:sigma-54 dependent transcriptional regulator [Candidatus Haliotispira prima]|uniref:Sigma-54 dependent transcriptional regulator n=1 Tax=Candidatus Haliotispira prima TaxID=3034016 RepID=A0ABY8MIG9_9SPIO|nr:sigma-54 dependent transcriptional regulator [Candidatus Haliotispira prima]